MQEAFIKVFTTGDTSQTIALAIILGLTFLLGMFVWALLAHFPSARKLKKSNESLESENTVLKKENKDISERYTVVNAKYNRATEDLQTAEANLKEKNEKIDKQTIRLKKLSDQLELYKDNARNYKEANEKLIEEYKKTTALSDKYKEQVEDMKGLIEEVEKEKGGIAEENRAAARAKREAERNLKTTTEKLEKSEQMLDLLKKDLDAALEQKAELKKMLTDLEASVQLEDTDNSELKTQLVGLKSHVRELEAENTDLMERLAPYLATEQEKRRQDDEMEDLLVNLLVEAEQNMEQDGFFVDYDEKELIEDKKYLEKVLAEEAAEEQPIDKTEKEIIELDAEEEEHLDRMLGQVEAAMNMKGFYEDMHKEVLIEQKDEDVTHLSDEDLMNKHMDSVEEMVQNALFFSEEATEDGFVEDEATLKNKLQEIEYTEHPIDSEEEQITLDDDDHSAMDAALDKAMEAMNAEGLYAPIDSEKLVGSESDTTENFKSNGTYENELEQAVVQEIGRSIPKASSNQKDDLQQIDGIGLFIEQRLNQLGIYTYEQISKFDPAFIAKLGAALGFSEQTIARDKWVEQARSLVKEV